MAEHADASQEKLSEMDRADPTPAAAGHTDEGSSDLSNRASLKEKCVAEVSTLESAAEGPAHDADDCDAAVDGEVDDQVDDAQEDAVPAKERMSPVRLAAMLGLVAVVSLGALAGWFGFRLYQSHRAQEQRQLLVQVARQGALNLTTIDYEHADADIQRIVDSATGTFYDDFSHRSKPFIDVVKKAQSKSVGTITESGLESQSGSEAQVLVAVSVKTSNLGAAEQDPRHWRMRITVQKVGNDAKVSNVAFVP
jgi:Mce-associated membrane protein